MQKTNSWPRRNNFTALKPFACLISCALLFNCSSSDSNGGVGGVSSIGGSSSSTGGSALSSTGGASIASTGSDTGGSMGTSVGGNSAIGGDEATGGTSSSGGYSASPSGGTAASGGANSTGGMMATGGMMSTGGNYSTVVGGGAASGGSQSAGGTTSSMGGMTSNSTGGTPATAGASSTGGMLSTGGSATTGGASTIGGGTSTSTTPTFTQIYDSIISAKCVSCHGSSASASGSLSMGSKQMAYDNLVGTSGNGVAAAGPSCGQFTMLRVKPGDAYSSLIWEKVNSKLKGTSPTCGSAMPLSGSALTQTQVDQLAAWINAGAIND